ncbi:MAG: alpha/beta hydrolase [Pseudomonadota bacterium]
MTLEQLTIASPTSANINVYLAIPEEVPQGLVHVNHGLAEHAKRYTPFLRALSSAGFVAIAHDHRGHGMTTAPDALLGQFGKKHGARFVIEDMFAVHDKLAKRWPNLPTVVFGHSAGGLIALNYALCFPDRVQGLAVWNSPTEPGFLGRVGKAVLALEGGIKGTAAPSGIIPKLSFEAYNYKFRPNRTDFDWLSRDEAAVDAYAADPLCGFSPSISMWKDVLKLSFACDGFQKFRADLPIHLLAGAEDPTTEGGRMTKSLVKRMSKAGLTNIDINILPDMRHESLNEVGKDEVIESFITWVKKVVKHP